jgi:hypothetical protein
VKVGYDALTKAEAGIKGELSSAVSDLKSRVQLTPDAENAFQSIQSGKIPSAREYAAIEAATKGDPRAQNALELARDAHVMSVLKGTGKVSGDSFVGGAGAKLAGVLGVTPHSAAKGALAALAVEHLGSHLIAQSPGMLAGCWWCISRRARSRQAHGTTLPRQSLRATLR